MEDSQAWAAVCLALACLTSWGSSMPLAAYQSSHVSGYPGALFSPQYPGYPPSPYFYAPGPASKSSLAKGATGTAQQYPVYSNPQGFPNYGYYFAPYLAPSGVFPVTQQRSPSPKGAPIGQLPAGGQYVIYPAGTTPFRDERQTLWQNVQNFIQGLRPNPSERPNPLNPLNWFGANQPANPPTAAAEEIEEEAPAEGAGEPQPTVSNEVAEEEKPAEATVEQEGKPDDENPSGMPAGTYDPQADVEPEAAAVETEEAQAEAAEIASRFLARSRYLPIVGFPRNVPRKRMGTTEGGAGGGAGAAPAGDDDVGEQEEEEEDSVVIGPGGSNPSVAQAKPAAIALAGVGGVAAAAPTATAVVGANGLAVSAPSATAIAGPSAGAPPPGLLPKFPTRRVPAQKVSPEEARRNAAMIEAARRQATLLASGLGNVGTSSFPTLPIMAYQVWRGDKYGLN
ncbi:fibrous sheath CABYR-binding protein [Hetaerina americana]|uniref:fibrous sheath CABYR-binding protein n=1 Tax=Hetaerina americana TaxID=62018 RepID=UPI003A7F116D